MTKFDTPRDPEMIDRIMHLRFLDGMDYFDGNTPYFNPEESSFSLIDSGIEPESVHGSLPVYEFFNIPEDHPLEMRIDWKGMAEQWRSHCLNPECFVKACRKLESLDTEILKDLSPVLASFEYCRWEFRVVSFLRDRFSEVLTGYEEELLRLFVRGVEEAHHADLIKFYRPSVQVS
ncbi:MAG: hypothetical protein ACRC62_36990 [Microcoleus sp.]